MRVECPPLGSELMVLEDLRLNRRTWVEIVSCSLWPLVLPFAFWGQQLKMIRSASGRGVPRDPAARQGWETVQLVRQLDLRLLFVQSVVAACIAAAVCLVLRKRMRSANRGYLVANVALDLSLALLLFVTPWLVSFAMWHTSISSVVEFWAKDPIPTHIPTACVIASGLTFIGIHLLRKGPVRGATA